MRLACSTCGSIEGSDSSWRYVDGHYEHKCPRKTYALGHYVPNRDELSPPERKNWVTQQTNEDSDAGRIE